jgi:DNA-binding ferritin-like protein
VVRHCGPFAHCHQHQSVQGDQSRTFPVCAHGAYIHWVERPVRQLCVMGLCLPACTERSGQRVGRHQIKARSAICAELNHLLADVFAIYLTTKNFHWHMSSPHFRDYHLLLDEHADQIFAMTDANAECARKLDGDTLRSIGDIARHQRLLDVSDQQSHSPRNCLRRLLQS